MRTKNYQISRFFLCLFVYLMYVACNEARVHRCYARPAATVASTATYFSLLLFRRSTVFSVDSFSMSQIFHVNRIFFVFSFQVYLTKDIHTQKEFASKQKHEQCSQSISRASIERRYQVWRGALFEPLRCSGNSIRRVMGTRCTNFAPVSIKRRM